ncbi:PREDICTED: uncharacterized protein LOC106150355 [Chinchilla lanigera]|uniref:uncharacterized protein LOC106150355 n=1 Tax=Chinchilla lanigera TaxID=34839 RepID=UPI000696EBEC|nr:PREDICTED: uncharacterized protein LOC106150355 [Chinchilla lanigera]
MTGPQESYAREGADVPIYKHKEQSCCYPGIPSLSRRPLGRALPQLPVPRCAGVRRLRDPRLPARGCASERSGRAGLSSEGRDAFPTARDLGHTWAARPRRPTPVCLGAPRSTPRARRTGPGRYGMAHVPPLLELYFPRAVTSAGAPQPSPSSALSSPRPLLRLCRDGPGLTARAALDDRICLLSPILRVSFSLFLPADVALIGALLLTPAGRVGLCVSSRIRAEVPCCLFSTRSTVSGLCSGTEAA